MSELYHHPPMLFESIEKKKGVTLPKGKWRLALVVAAARIEDEKDRDGNLIAGNHPKPKNPFERAAYEFLKICETGKVEYIKELANRLDGLPAQDITLTDKRDLDEMSDEQLNAAAEALRAILAAQDSSAGAGAASKPEPIG